MTGPDHQLPATLVLVPDYVVGTRDWADERRSLAAHLTDPAGIPRRVLLIEPVAPGEAHPDVPDDIAAMAPHVRVEFVESTSSKVCKDVGASLAEDEIIAVADADCIPRPGWLHQLVTALDEDPDLGVVSSLTHYPDDHTLARAASVLQRGYLDHAAITGLDPVSINGAAYRRDVLTAHPFPTDAGSPFLAGELRNRALREAGVRCRVTSDAGMVHAFEGWRFVADFHRNKGFQSATRFAALESASRLGVALRAVVHRMRADWPVVRTVGPRRLRGRDWPVLLALFAVVRVLEFTAALRVDDPDSSFRARTGFR